MVSLKSTELFHLKSSNECLLCLLWQDINSEAVNYEPEVNAIMIQDLMMIIYVGHAMASEI